MRLLEKLLQVDAVGGGGGDTYTHRKYKRLQTKKKNFLELPDIYTLTDGQKDTRELQGLLILVNT